MSVPLRTAMFDSAGNLARPWYLFFQELSEGASGGGETAASDETLASTGTVTPDGTLSYHVINQAGNVVVNAMAGSLAGDPHTFKITANGHSVIWDAAYIGLAGVALDTRAGVWNIISFVTDVGGATFVYKSSILGAS